MAEFYAVIDAVPLDILQESGEETIVDVGDTARSFDGDYLQRVDTTKLEWALSHAPVDWAAYVNLRDVVFAPGVHVLTGTIVNDVPMDVYILREKGSPVPDGDAVKWILAFRVVEK